MTSEDINNLVLLKQRLEERLTAIQDFLDAESEFGDFMHKSKYNPKVTPLEEITVFIMNYGQSNYESLRGMATIERLWLERCNNLLNIEEEFPVETEININ